MNNPLVPEDLARGRDLRADARRSFFRACVAHLLAASNSNLGYPHEVAERTWAGDRDVAWLTRAATAPTSTTSAPGLLRTMLADILTSLGPASAGSTLLSRGISLSFANNGAVLQIPRIVADGGGASFVAEAAPIPVRQFLAGALTLQPHKFASISPFTGELFQHSIPNIEIIVRQVLTENVGLALDLALLGSTAGDSTRPPGLRAGIAALSPSAATSPSEAMIADIANLVGDVSVVAGNAPIILIASPERTMKVRLRAPRDLPVEILASGAVGDDELLAIASNAVASAVDPVPRFDISNETLLHLDDAAPLPISSTGTPNSVAAPIRSMWQTDTTGLRLIMEVSWGLRHTSGLAWIDNITAW
jgi:Phage capsid family